MATNDNKTTTTICAVGALRDGGAVEELMMIACYDIAAAVYDCAPVRSTHCALPSSPFIRHFWIFCGRRRREESILLFSINGKVNDRRLNTRDSSDFIDDRTIVTMSTK